MTCKSFPLRLCATAPLLATAFAAQATLIIHSGESMPLKPQLTEASVKVSHVFGLQYAQPDVASCAAVLTFTDGSPDQNVVLNAPAKNFTLEKAYAKGGFFQVALFGKDHSGLPGCAGAKVASVLVEDMHPTAAMTGVPLIMPAITGLKSWGGEQPNDPTLIELAGHGQCKYHIDYGNGVGVDRDDMLPRRLDAAYTINSFESKKFTMTVTGLAGKCKGAASTTVWVTGPGQPPAGNNGQPSTGTVVGIAASTLKPKPLVLPAPLVISNCPAGKRC